MDKDEIISKLGWFTQMKSIPPLTDKFKTEQIIFFENIIHFLQDNGLTTKEILTYIIHSGFISGYQNRYGDNLKPPTNVYHRMTA